MHILASTRTALEEFTMSIEPVLKPVGVIRSSFKSLDGEPPQGDESEQDTWVEVFPWAAAALEGIDSGEELVILTWLHEADRNTLQVPTPKHPRRPTTGVFLTRSADRPNPIGVHTVAVMRVDGLRMRIVPMDAIDGTPVVDIKLRP
jgi:tRNA-Thr(GGU) m(6)t(6)A37 methyltransferase TsaA